MIYSLGREIKTITIQSANGINKEIIFIDAGIHAREWTAPAFALYIIDVLSTKSEMSGNLLNDFVFIILPCLNTDGDEKKSLKIGLFEL